MARLTGKTISYIQVNRKKVAKEFSLRYNLTTVLKGYRTVVAGPRGEIWVNPTGNPGMATAGSGDVLTGIIASLLGQGIKPFLAAKLGVYIHGLSGDLAAKEKGQISLIAGNIINKLPVIFKRYSK
jgi:NAD(P)H-hydrate epimerase